MRVFEKNVPFLSIACALNLYVARENGRQDPAFKKKKMILECCYRSCVFVIKWKCVNTANWQHANQLVQMQQKILLFVFFICSQGDHWHIYLCTKTTSHIAEKQLHARVHTLTAVCGLSASFVCCTLFRTSYVSLD